MDHFLTRVFFIRSWPQWITPNVVSCLRVFVFGPPIILLMYVRWFWLALILFVLASICDALDGALARLRECTSATGAYIDALADKVLNIPILLYISWQCPWPYTSLLLIIPIAGMAIVLTIVRTRNAYHALSPQVTPRAASQRLAAAAPGKWKMRLEVSGTVLALLGLTVASATDNIALSMFLSHLGALLLFGSFFPFSVFSLLHHLVPKHAP